MNDYATGTTPVISRRREALRVITGLLIMDVEQFVEINRNRLSSLRDGPPDIEPLIHSLARTTSRLGAEAKSLINEGHGHSRFSESSWQNLQTQLETLRLLVEEPVSLINLLIDINPEAAMSLGMTLERVVKLARPGSGDDSEDSRILQLLAGLNLQLKAFEDRLTRSPVN